MATTKRDLKGRNKRIYDAALDAANKKNFVYAVELLREILRKFPDFLDARLQLRQYSLDRLEGKINFWHQLIGSILALGPLVKSWILVAKKDYDALLDNAESALAFDPTAPLGLYLMARAAEMNEMPELTVATLELAVQYHDKSLLFLPWLGNVYATVGMGKKCLEIRQRICDLQPNNKQYEEAKREATALAAMDEGGWVDAERGEGDYRDLIRDKDQATLLEQQERSAKDVDALDNLIANQLAMVEERDAVDTRRKLAELYARDGQYEKALENYDRVIELAGVMDPSIDDAITKIMTRQFDDTIKEWSAYAEQEDISEEDRDNALKQKNELEQQKNEMLTSRLSERVRRYPNSAPERFRLARLLFDLGQIDEALKHFQVCQKHPQYKQQATFFMGQCFAAKGLHDLAIESFVALSEDMVKMSQRKKECLYFLAKSYEAVGKMEEAKECYKHIYQVDMDFKDVGQIMETLYKA